MKCDELKRFDIVGKYRDEETMYEFRPDGVCYDTDDVDSAIAELKDKCQMHDFFWEGCGFAKRGFKNTIAVSEALDRLEAENRRFRMALWLARAQRANDKARIFYFAESCGVKLNIDGYSNREKGHTRMCTARWWRLTWLKVERKCRAKAEEYK
jgi:hypothetical protein